MEKWHTNKEIPNSIDSYIIKWKDHSTYSLATSKEWVEGRLKTPSDFTEIERWAYIKDFEDTSEQHQQKQIDWEQRRYEIAKVMLPTCIEEYSSMDDFRIEKGAEYAMMCADALIKELKQQDNG